MGTEFFDKNSIILSIDDAKNPDMDKEIFVDAHLEKYSLRELNGILAEMTNIVKDYDKLNHRNHKKDELHLNKHAMHLVRLYIMCLDILKDHRVVTYRENEHDLLMAIRTGYFMNPDATFKKEFFDIVDDYEKQIERACNASTLPEVPDYELVNKLVMKINRFALEVY